MIAVQITTQSASFRQSLARSYGETYCLVPPATVYGLLLSLVGETDKLRHEGVSLAFAYANIPKVASSIKKLSRYKYGAYKRQKTKGNQLDIVESLCNISMLCFVDSRTEMKLFAPSMETRVISAIKSPQSINRFGVLSLGLSDDLVDEVKLIEHPEGKWFKLEPLNRGTIELPIWVDHIGSVNTCWQRYSLTKEPSEISLQDPGPSAFTAIARPPTNAPN